MYIQCRKVLICTFYVHIHWHCQTHTHSHYRNFGSGTQSVEVLPAFERTQLRWNGNPYQLDTEQENSEMDLGAWLYCPTGVPDG